MIQSIFSLPWTVLFFSFVQSKVRWRDQLTTLDSNCPNCLMFCNNCQMQTANNQGQVLEISINRDKSGQTNPLKRLQSLKVHNINSKPHSTHKQSAMNHPYDACPTPVSANLWLLLLFIQLLPQTGSPYRNVSDTLCAGCNKTCTTHLCNSSKLQNNQRPM